MNTIHTICIVDDDEEIRSLLSDYLRRNGFSTCTAGNAAEFLEIQRRVPCSLIVMDIMMPRMNGLEAARLIRGTEDRPDLKILPILAMSANAFDDDVKKSLESGMNDHLSKPIEMDKLIAALSRVLK